MSTSILLGILGIIVSIAVGFGTYYLAEKRGKRNRWQSAKDTVLRDLSKSLGEGNIPDPPVILATIRSVLRSHNATDLAVVTLDEVTDDLLRQITSDPFLEAERRTDLQKKVLDLRETYAKQVKPKEVVPREETFLDMARLSWPSLLAGLLASLITGLTVVGVPDVVKKLSEDVPKIVPNLTIVLLGMLLTLLTATLFMFFMRTRNGKDE